MALGIGNCVVTGASESTAVICFRRSRSRWPARHQHVVGRRRHIHQARAVRSPLGRALVHRCLRDEAYRATLDRYHRDAAAGSGPETAGRISTPTPGSRWRRVSRPRLRLVRKLLSVHIDSPDSREPSGRVLLPGAIAEDHDLVDVLIRVIAPHGPDPVVGFPLGVIGYPIHHDVRA